MKAHAHFKIDRKSNIYLSWLYCKAVFWAKCGNQAKEGNRLSPIIGAAERAPSTGVPEELTG
jgi:hypothetical protein